MSYQVLTNTHQCILEWVQASNGQVPPHAVLGGHLANSEPLYIGRVNHQGSLVPGNIQASRHCLCIPYDYQAWEYKNYEVLCVKTGTGK
ncbi:unnamed protein product [Rotaria sp. Silwood1]|nr:unnamed protein product [Rotaria sp. Silwood1]